MSSANSATCSSIAGTQSSNQAEGQNFDPNIDLSQDVGNGNGGGSILAKSNKHNVQLDVQTYVHRRILFWLILLVCVGMYGLFVFYVFWSHYFRLLVIHTQFAVAIAMALLLVPSALLWGIMRSLYKDQKKEEEEGEKLSVSASEVVKIIGTLVKVYPPFSH